MNFSLHILAYAVALGWAVVAGALGFVAGGQLALAGMAVLFFSHVVRLRRASLLAAWAEAAWVYALVWSTPGRPELAWTFLPAVIAAGSGNRRQALQLGLIAGSAVVATSYLLNGVVSPVMVAAGLGLPLVGGLMIPRMVEVEKTIEKPLSADTKALVESERDARDAERTARRAYRELVGLYRELKDNWDGQEIGYRLAAATLSDDEPSDRLLEIALEATGAAGGGLWIADAHRRVLEVRSTIGGAPKTTRIALDDAQGIARKIVAGGQEHALGLVGKSGAWHEELILDGERILGLLALRDPTTNAGAVAHGLRLPLRYLLENSGRSEKLAAAEAKAQATELVLSREGPAGVASRAVELLKRFVDAEHWSVYLVDRKGAALRVLERGRPLDLMGPLGLSGDGFSSWLAADEVLHGNATMSRMGSEATRLRIRSVLAVPLSAGGKAVGAMILADAEPGRFDTAERQAILRLVEPISQALDLASVREQPSALVRLDAATGLSTYREFASQLDELLATELPFSLVRFSAATDGNRFAALGRAIAGSLPESAFATTCGSREILVCLAGKSGRDAEAVAGLVGQRFADLDLQYTVEQRPGEAVTREALLKALE